MLQLDTRNFHVKCQFNGSIVVVAIYMGLPRPKLLRSSLFIQPAHALVKRVTTASKHGRITIAKQEAEEYHKDNTVSNIPSFFTSHRRRRRRLQLRV